MEKRIYQDESLPSPATDFAFFSNKSLDLFLLLSGGTVCIYDVQKPNNETDVSMFELNSSHELGWNRELNLVE